MHRRIALFVIGLGLASLPCRAQEAPPEPEDAVPEADGAPPATDASAPVAAPATPTTPAADAPQYTETMVVTASRVEESLLDVPVSTSVVGPAQIETSPADNYADLLRGVPGLNVVQTSARDINFVSRGATSTLATSQLALVDGRSIYQDFFGFVMWDVLPVNFDEIQQIEVLRGPGSAVWGANALGGVINVRTKSPRDTPGGLFTVGAGERGTRSSGVRWGQAFRRGSYRLAASWFEQDPWPRNDALPDGTPLPPEAAFANEGAQQPKLDLRFDWDPSEKRRFSYRLGAAGTSGIMHSGIGPFTIDPATRMSYGEVSYAGPRLEAKAYVNWMDGDAVNLLNTLPFAFLNKTWVADATWRSPVSERSLLLIGGNVRVNKFDLSLAPGEDSRNEAGAFAEFQRQVGKRGLLSAGARLDWFDTVGLAAAPRLSYVFKAREDQSVRFAWSRAYRSPSLINNFLSTAVPNIITLDPSNPPFVFVTFAEGNAHLREETVNAIEVGWTREAGPHVITAAIYRNDISDNIDFYPAVYYSPEDPPIGWPLRRDQVPRDTMPKLFTYRNVGKVRAQGVEFSWNATWRHGISTVATYAFQDDNVAVDDDDREPLNVNQPPHHQLTLGANVIRGPWRASITVTGVDRAFWSDVLDERFWGWTDSHVLLSSSAGWEGKHLGVRVNGTNLLDGAVQQHVFGDIIRRKVTAELRVRW